MTVLRTAPGIVFIWLIGQACAAEFNIRDFGATPDDDRDDTRSILAALDACGKSGGGVVFVPAGIYRISRQGSESPILPLPSNATLRGEGPASVLRFAPEVNRSNFWRMLGAAAGGSRNLTVRDLRLDGSNTFPAYDKGKTPEHNHGVFLSDSKDTIENVLLTDLLVENFSGDCVALGQGCRNVTVRNIKVRNFVRQGIQLAGGNGACDYLITGCQDLEHTVKPGGSTIHVEHARGLRNVTITGNHCRQSILAGGVDGMIIRDNHVTGTILGNGNTNLILQGNLVRGIPGAKGHLIRQGYADGLIIRDNVLVVADGEQSGIYVWGSSKYNPNPSRDVSIVGNVIRATETATMADKGVQLNGVEGGQVSGNRIRAASRVSMLRVTGVSVDPQDLGDTK